MTNNNGERRLSRRVADIEMRMAQIQKDQRRINELLKLQQNWGSEIANWFGRPVSISLRNGELVIGKFKWSDKYQLAVVPKDRKDNNPIIVNKASINTIELLGGESAE